MNPEDTKAAKLHLSVLSGHLTALNKKIAEKDKAVRRVQFEIIYSDILRAEKELHISLPHVDRSLLSMNDSGNAYYIEALASHLTSVVGRLDAQLADEDTVPGVETKTFEFISNKDIRSIVGRDYREVQRAFLTGCWKSVIILSGGLIEAILLDLLQANQSQVTASAKAPNQKDLNKWFFADLINVAVELNLVTPGIDRLSHSVRDYRNLVHPGVEIREKLVVGKEEATIAFEVLNMLHRDLRKK